MRLRKEPGRARADAARRGDQRARRTARRRASRAAARYEYELEAVLDYTFRRRGARGPGLRDASSAAARTRPSSTTSRTTSRSRDGELVLIDAGCELRGLRLRRDAHLSGRRPLRRRRRATSTRSCSRAQLAALARARSPARRCPRSTTTALRELVRGHASSSACSPGDVDELIASEALQPLLHAPHQPLARPRRARRRRLRGGRQAAPRSSRHGVHGRARPLRRGRRRERAGARSAASACASRTTCSSPRAAARTSPRRSRRTAPTSKPGCARRRRRELAPRHAPWPTSSPC